jgi:hypothetical protein
MTIDEKLDLIIQLLRQQASTRSPSAIIASDQVDAVSAWLKTAKPGFYSAAEIASQCGLGFSKSEAIALGRILDAKGVRRARTNNAKGFMIS